MLYEVIMQPGEVIFSERYQTLSATLGGVIDTCNVSTTDGTGTIDVSEDRITSYNVCYTKLLR